MFLIVNPVAGRGRSLKALGIAQTFFEQHHLKVEVLRTQYRGHATELVNTLPQNATILSLGGDGTLHEVMTACVYTDRTVGILPAGSGDDFAYALGIKRDNLQQALEVIQKGHIKKVDTATVNSIPFINAFGVGFDADVAYGIYNAPKLLKERNAYLYSVITTLGKLKNIPVKVTIDGQHVFSGPSLLVSTQNGPRTGGSFYFAPQAKIDDGLLDVVIAGQFSRLGTLNILPKVMKGAHASHPNILILRGKDILLKWESPRPGHMEGELLLATNTFHIQIQPKSLNVFAPN
jgi:YegS/Rv2252/BmrU family lipid kinase